MNRKLEKFAAQSVRRREARKWLQSDPHGATWDELLKQAGGDANVAEQAAESLMLSHWVERTFEEELRLFNVWNTAGQHMHVLAESARQAPAIALKEGHLREYDNGKCEEVTDCAKRWGGGFASAVERAKGQGFSGRIERKGNHAVMGARVFSPLHQV